jgi:DNA-binding transcriptional regulator YhcF (GntR family)
MNIITTEHGKGSYITPLATEMTNQFRHEAIIQAINHLLDEAHLLGISSADIQQILKERENI